MPGATAVGLIVSGLLSPPAPWETAGMPGGPFPKKVGVAEADDTGALDAGIGALGRGPLEVTVDWLAFCLKFFGFFFNTFKIAE